MTKWRTRNAATAFAVPLRVFVPCTALKRKRQLGGRYSQEMCQVEMLN